MIFQKKVAPEIMWRICLISSIFFAFGTLKAQDPIFSQFFAAPLQLNPAFAGTSEAPRFGAAYRNQWAGFNTAYKTYSAYYEQQISRLNSGFGLYLEGDNAGNGILESTRFSLNYAYLLPLTERLSVKIGVEAGMYQTNLNWDRLVFLDQIDPVFGPGVNTDEMRPDQTSRSMFDASAGLLVIGEKLWFGYSMKHLTTPNQSLNLTNNNLKFGLPIRHSFHAGTEITVKEGNKQAPSAFVSPNVLFVSQGPFQQLNVGAYAGLGSVFSGFWYRHTFGNPDAGIILVGIREGIFKLGLSYDFTVSKIANVSGGTFEVTTNILLDQDEYFKKKQKQNQTFDCMRMFD